MKHVSYLLLIKNSQQNMIISSIFFKVYSLMNELISFISIFVLFIIF